MEPIPLRTRQILAKTEEDLELAVQTPGLLTGAVTENEEDFARLSAYGSLPVGKAITCPRGFEQMQLPRLEKYILGCKVAFRPQLSDAAAFYYLTGAESFASLRAAVLALTDMTGRTIIAQLHAVDEGRMADGTDCLAAVGVLQRIGVSSIIVTADEPEQMEDALERIAPYARLSVGVSVPRGWLESGIRLTNVEVLLPHGEDSGVQIYQALKEYRAGRTAGRDHDDVILAPDGRDAHFIDAVIDISDEIRCDHKLEERLLEVEDEQAAALKLLVEEEDDLYDLETDLYMLSRPVALCAQSPELMEKALRVYHGLAIYDGTWELDSMMIKYFTEKYGMICL